MTLSNTVAWLVLLAAGLLEVVWSVSMKASEGFTRPPLTAITIVAAWFSFWLLGMSLKALPVGTAYAVWTGIGAIGAAVLGIVLFKEPATVARNRLHPADRRGHSGTQGDERSLNDMRRPRPWRELAMAATAREWHAAKRCLGAGNRARIIRPHH